MPFFERLIKTVDPEYERAKQRAFDAIKRVESQISILDIEYAGATVELDFKEVTKEWQQVNPAFPSMMIRLSDMPSSKYATTIECMTGPENMGKHRHKNWEACFMLEGSMKDHVTGKVYKPGDYVSFLPMQWHHPEYLEDSYCLLMWKPRLHEL